MFIIDPDTQSVLTLKPDMTLHDKKWYSIITWERPTFTHDKSITTTFKVDKTYDLLTQDFKSHKQFIIASWQEI